MKLTRIVAGTACFLLGAPQIASSATFLKSDEEVIFFPTIGWRVKDGWQVKIHGRVFESEKRPVLPSVLQRFLGIDDRELSVEEGAIFRSRARLFFDDSERGKKITVAFGDKRHELPRSEANGHFTGKVRLAESIVGDLAANTHTMSWSTAKRLLHYVQARFTSWSRAVYPSSPISTTRSRLAR